MSKPITPMRGSLPHCSVVLPVTLLGEPGHRSVCRATPTPPNGFLGCRSTSGGRGGAARAARALDGWRCGWDRGWSRRLRRGAGPRRPGRLGVRRVRRRRGVWRATRRGGVGWQGRRVLRGRRALRPTRRRLAGYARGPVCGAAPGCICGGVRPCVRCGCGGPRTRRRALGPGVRCRRPGARHGARRLGARGVGDGNLAVFGGGSADVHRGETSRNDRQDSPHGQQRDRDHENGLHHARGPRRPGS